MEVDHKKQKQIQAELDDVARWIVELEAMVKQLGDETSPETMADLEAIWAREMELMETLKRLKGTLSADQGEDESRPLQAEITAPSMTTPQMSTNQPGPSGSTSWHTRKTPKGWLERLQYPSPLPEHPWETMGHWRRYCITKATDLYIQSVSEGAANPGSQGSEDPQGKEEPESQAVPLGGH